MGAPSRVPAENAVMGVVHDASRRDLDRVRETVGGPVPPARGGVVLVRVGGPVPPARGGVVLVRGFARSYRRACARRWGPDVAVGPRR